MKGLVALTALGALVLGGSLRGKRPNGDAAADQQPAARGPGPTLAWNAVSCSLQSKAGTTTLLRDVSGIAQPGRVLAIMGPSGAGKTTLLNALAGQVPASAATTLRGTVTVDGVPFADAAARVAFVKQEDVYFSRMTVRETLDFAARLQLPASLPESAKAAAVDGLLTKLGLAKCAATIVGDAKTRGVSGGERKRLAIALEMLACPGLLLLDEPTTGLDSFSAESVVSALRRLATSDGTTVVMTIHQPRASIFAAVDDLLLLADGRVVYFGPAALAVAHFAALGHPPPPGAAPAEWLIDLVAIDYSDAASESQSRTRLARLAAAWPPMRTSAAVASVGRRPGSQMAVGAGQASTSVSALGQFRLLLRRAWRQAMRDGATNAVRAATAVSSAFIFGSIFHRLGLKQAAIQSRLGLLQVAVINTAMSSVVKTLQAFPRERAIVARERAKRAYGLTPYLAAKVLAELPLGAAFPALFGSLLYPAAGADSSLNAAGGRFARFLGILTLESFVAGSLGLAIGAAAPSAEAAVALGPSIMVVFIIMGGFYANEATVPGPLRWLSRTSLIKHGFEALCVNDLTGLKFETSGAPGEARTGEQALARVGFDGSNGLGGPAAALGRLLLVNYALTWAVLKARKPVFQKMEAP